MKQLSIVLVVLALVSCDKKDDPGSSGLLMGEWYVATSEDEVSVDGTEYREYLTNLDSVTRAKYFTYNEVLGMLPPTGFYTDMNFEPDGTWSGQAGTITGTWTLSSDGGQITLIDNIHPALKHIARVTKLTDADFWVLTTPGLTLDDTKVPNNFTYTATIKFTRKLSQ